MVILFSKFVDEFTLFRTKAPRGMMFSVEDIHITILSSGGNNLVMVDYLFEDDVRQLDITNINAIALVNTAVTIVQDFEYTTPLKTKFISMAPDTGAAFVAYVIVAGNLIKATKTELLIEWFRKGR